MGVFDYHFTGVILTSCSRRCKVSSWYLEINMGSKKDFISKLFRVSVNFSDLDPLSDSATGEKPLLVVTSTAIAVEWLERTDGETEVGLGKFAISFLTTTSGVCPVVLADLLTFEKLQAGTGDADVSSPGLPLLDRNESVFNRLEALVRNTLNEI